MYQGKMGFSEWESEVFNKGTNLKKAIDDAYILYKKFYDLTYGLTPAQILALPTFTSSGMSESDITAMQNAVNSMGDFYKAMHNEAVGQVDRFGYLVKFL
jgi:hypothetical protein